MTSCPGPGQVQGVQGPSKTEDPPSNGAVIYTRAKQQAFGIKPPVSNSNPASFSAVQAITAYPYRLLARTCGLERLLPTPPAPEKAGSIMSQL
jgi:hypothetical protein